MTKPIDLAKSIHEKYQKGVIALRAKVTELETQLDQARNDLIATTGAATAAAKIVAELEADSKQADEAKVVPITDGKEKA